MALEERQVHLFVGRCGPLAARGVAGHPHHGQPFRVPVEVVEGQPLPDRVRAGPEALGQPLVHDDGAGCAQTIVLGEIAAAHERQSHGLEVAGKDHAKGGAGGFARLGRRPPFDLERESPDVAGQGQVVDRAGRGHAGHRADTLQDLAVEGEPSRRLLRTRSGERHHRARHAARVEAGIEAAQGDERPDHQARADEQDEGQGQLGRHQEPAEPMPFRAHRAAALTVVQGAAQVEARGLQGGHETEGDAGGEGDHDRDRQHAWIQARRLQARQVAGADRDQHAQDGRGQGDARGSAHGGQNHAFGEELLDHARAAGPERGA